MSLIYNGYRVSYKNKPKNDSILCNINQLKMTDLQVRIWFHRTILKGANEDDTTFVLDELGLKNGTNRADIAVLNGKLIGYEIKTARDTLIRFSAQVKAYNEVFDKAFVICAQKHLSKVRQLIPSWWGIYLIRQENDNAFSFLEDQKARCNPKKSTYAIAQLLWKHELLDILSRNPKLVASLKTNKHQMYRLLADNYSPQRFGQIALTYLKKRDGWRINPKQSLLYGGYVPPIPTSSADQ